MATPDGTSRVAWPTQARLALGQIHMEMEWVGGVFNLQLHPAPHFNQAAALYCRMHMQASFQIHKCIHYCSRATGKCASTHEGLMCLPGQHRLDPQMHLLLQPHNWQMCQHS